MEQVVMEQRLTLKKSVLDVVPELDDQRHRPPFPGQAGESLAQYPDTDQHDERVAVVERFRTHQPRVKQAQHAAGLSPWPAQVIYLPRLGQMFRPMSQHY